ncbi:hypothetical protein D1007_23950 [Hordeum vulgare]|nr:hypothetical protein D1007_23950 [Hordeum vulgare]
MSRRELMLPMYGDWEEYRLTYHTYQADLEYVKFCVEMSEKIKLMRNELVAYFQSLKIALQFRNISGRSVLSGFEEHLASLRFDFNPHKKDLVSVYVELWKRVAKKKVNLGEALRQLYEDDIFPSRKALIKYALDSYPDISLIKYDYDTYVDGIDKKVSLVCVDPCLVGIFYIDVTSNVACLQLPEDEARPLIMEAVKKMFKKRKNYLDYTTKKLEVATRIGLIPTTA